jgi:hypothetical protein
VEHHDGDACGSGDVNVRLGCKLPNEIGFRQEEIDAIRPARLALKVGEVRLENRWWIRANAIHADGSRVADRCREIRHGDECHAGARQWHAQTEQRRQPGLQAARARRRRTPRAWQRGRCGGSTDELQGVSSTQFPLRIDC